MREYYNPGKWNTEQELVFLKGLGNYREEKVTFRSSRKELLEKYYNTIDKRVNWAYMDKQLIQQTCLDMIRDENIKNIYNI